MDTSIKINEDTLLRPEPSSIGSYIAGAILLIASGAGFADCKKQGEFDQILKEYPATIEVTVRKELESASVQIMKNNSLKEKTTFTLHSSIVPSTRLWTDNVRFINPGKSEWNTDYTSLDDGRTFIKIDDTAESFEIITTLPENTENPCDRKTNGFECYLEEDRTRSLQPLTIKVSGRISVGGIAEGRYEVMLQDAANNGLYPIQSKYYIPQDWHSYLKTMYDHAIYVSGSAIKIPPTLTKGEIDRGIRFPKYFFQLLDSPHLCPPNQNCLDCKKTGVDSKTLTACENEAKRRLNYEKANPGKLALGKGEILDGTSPPEGKKRSEKLEIQCRDEMRKRNVLKYLQDPE